MLSLLGALRDPPPNIVMILTYLQNMILTNFTSAKKNFDSFDRSAEMIFLLHTLQNQKGTEFFYNFRHVHLIRVMVMKWRSHWAFMKTYTTENISPLYKSCCRQQWEGCNFCILASSPPSSPPPPSSSYSSFSLPPNFSSSCWGATPSSSRRAVWTFRRRSCKLS